MRRAWWRLLAVMASALVGGCLMLEPQIGVGISFGPAEVIVTP